MATGLRSYPPNYRSKRYQIWVANYVLMEYGTGADYGRAWLTMNEILNFPQKMNLPIDQGHKV